MSSVKSPHICIAILDDHQIVIDGLKLLLNDHEGIEIVVEANTATDILSQINNKHIDILLTDITMPSSAMDGYELSMKIRREFPDMKILALSMNESGAIISKMIDDAVVNGYISKAGGKDELIHAIETIAKGEYFFSDSVMQQYEAYKKIMEGIEVFHLTARELQIISCIMKHYSNKQIANELFISERTVETHRKNIYRKTNTKGEASLIQFIMLHNLFP